MELHLTGKVAIVTEASTGIGLAITQALAVEGVNVVAGACGGSLELTALAPEEVADVVLLLAIGQAGNVTGSDVATDGGLVTTI